MMEADGIFRLWIAQPGEQRPFAWIANNRQPATDITSHWPAAWMLVPHVLARLCLASLTLGVRLCRLAAACLLEARALWLVI